MRRGFKGGQNVLLSSNSSALRGFERGTDDDEPIDGLRTARVRPDFFSAMSAQQAPVDFEAFRALQGWTFTTDLTKADGLPDLDGVASTVEGGVPLDASTFDATTFDARLYEIAWSEDPRCPPPFGVGDRGVIQFHSADRCRVNFSAIS